MKPVEECPDAIEAGASLWWGPRTHVPVVEQKGAAAELVFVSRTGVYSLLSDGSRLVPVVEAFGQEVVYPADDPADEWVGLARFRTKRVTAADLSADGARVAYAVCHRLWGLDKTARVTKFEITEYDVRSTAPGTVRFPVRWGRDLHEISVWNRMTNTTEPVAVGRAPAWSPDGGRLAFLSEYDYAADSAEALGPDLRLYVVSAAGGPVRELARAVVRRPQWSPDGRYLAYITGVGPLRSDNAPGYALHTIGGDGDEARQVAVDVVSPAAWSPDGQRLAFAKAEGAEVALYTVAANGTAAQRVTTVDGWRADSPFVQYPRRAWISTVAWSPDGSTLLYACGGRVCVVRVDGVRVGTSVVSLPGGAEAVWSPDGTRIAVVSRLVAEPPRSISAVLYTMAPSGHDVRVLLQLDRGWGPHAVGARLREVPDVDGCRAGVAVPDPAANPGLVRDCEMLLRLQDLLAVRGLQWSDDQPMTAWGGVAVGGEPRRVRSLGPFPDSYGLTGLIPPMLGQISGLEELRLGGNHLGGVIPPELGRLSRLRILDLRGNNVGGSIPPELGQLPSLEVLLLDGTYLSGPIPPALGQLANLRQLDLSSTYLTGGIPPELGGLTQATFVRITGRRSELDATLGGSIPRELGRLTNLEFLDLSHSGLTGSIPPELGQMANLKALDLSGNRLVGSVPPELGQLTSLTTLALHDNQLSGSIPSALTRLPNVSRVFVDGNQLSGCLPPELPIQRRAQLRLPDCESAT